MSLFNIRDATPNDVPLITNSWLKRYRDAVHPLTCSDKVYYAYQHSVITAILQGTNCKALCAVNPEDPDHVYAYLVYEELAPGWVCGHWAYCKGAFRKFGVMSALITLATAGATKVSYSHRTNLVKYLDKDNKWSFIPSFVWALT